MRINYVCSGQSLGDDRHLHQGQPVTVLCSPFIFESAAKTRLTFSPMLFFSPNTYFRSCYIPNFLFNIHVPNMWVMLDTNCSRNHSKFPPKTSYMYKLYLHMFIIYGCTLPFNPNMVIIHICVHIYCKYINIFIPNTFILGLANIYKWQRRFEICNTCVCVSAIGT